MRTYVGAAVAVLALAAAAVGLVLTLTLKQDAATEDDLSSLRDQLSAVEQSASEAAQEDVQGLDRRLAELEDEVNRLSTGQTTTRRELKVVQDDIKELRSQVSSAGSSSDGAPARRLVRRLWQLVRRRLFGLALASGVPSPACELVFIRTRRACTRPASPLRSLNRSPDRREIAALRRTHTHAVPERRSHRCQPVTA